MEGAEGIPPRPSTEAAPIRPETSRPELSKNSPFLFRIFSGEARKTKIVRGNFCEVAAEAIAEAGGGAERSSISAIFAKIGSREVYNYSRELFDGLYISFV